MARDQVIRLILHAVAGLADCSVCSALISFKLRPCELDRVSELCCPVCGGWCRPIEASLVLDATAEPLP